MIKIFIFKIAIIVYLCLSSLSAFGIENPKIGARATAMGGNYRSIANDWSAMYWNPAGLVFTQGWSAGFSLEYAMLRPTFKAGDSYYFNQNNHQNFQPFSATYSNTIDGEPLNFLVPSFGISYSPGGKWAYGLGLWVSYGLATKWDILDTEGNINERGAYNETYPEFEYENSMKVFDLHPTVSYKINDKLSVGLGLSIIYGKVEIRRPAYVQNPYLYDGTLYKTLLTISDETQAETLDQMRLSPFDHLINEVEMSGTDITFGGNLGLMFKPTDKLSIGATIQMNRALEISGDYKQTAYFGDNEDYNALVQYYDERLFSKLVENRLISNQKYQVVTGIYSGQVLTLENTKANTIVPLPMKIGMGLSYSGIKNLVLASDLSFMQWSDWDTLLVMDENDQRISEMVQHWKNTLKAGIGAEYIAKFATFRAGFSFENNTPVNETISPAIPEIGQRKTIDVGMALHLLGGELSLNYEKIFIADHTIENWNYDKMGIALNMPGTYTMNLQSLMIGYSYTF